MEKCNHVSLFRVMHHYVYESVLSLCLYKQTLLSLTLVGYDGDTRSHHILSSIACQLVFRDRNFYVTRENVFDGHQLAHSSVSSLQHDTFMHHLYSNLLDYSIHVRHAMKITNHYY